MGTENTYWFQKGEMHFICTPFSKFFLTSHLLISKCFNFLSVITAGNKADDGKDSGCLAYCYIICRWFHHGHSDVMYRDVLLSFV